MTKATYDTEETVEVNGEVYSPNDHVYVSAPWNASDGAPWLIGRIMEFIREPLASGTSKKKKTRPIIQFKLAHYHRQRDLLSRHIIDCRLLEASMTFDVFCVSRLRGKCRVEFKSDRNADEVEGWKSTPDCFYFSQVYGRYTHRHYDLILTQNVKNAPPEVIQFLRNNYSYIFAEPGMGVELSEERRGCVSCRKWTTGADSVTCALCNRAYHFACLNPPLIRKPERGYRWACAPCSKKRQESIEDQKLLIAKAAAEQLSSATANNASGAAGSGRSLRDKGKKKEVTVMALVQPGSGPDGVLRTVDGWPFRYYGQYTEPTSVLDPMDSPYLYTAPRLGPRFQTTVPEEMNSDHNWHEPSQPRPGRPAKGEKRSRDGTPANPFAAFAEDIPRGGDETVDVISTPAQVEKWGESAVDEYVHYASRLPLYRSVGVSLIDRALRVLSESSSLDEARSKLGELSAKGLGFAHWTEGESHRMDNAIGQLGEDIRGALKLFPKKNWVDVTKFYYMFKGHKLPELSAHDTRQSASVSQSPDESLSILPSPSSKRPYSCVVCEVRSSDTWRRCPDALMAGASQARKCICNDCHLRWRKYGLQHVPVAHQEENQRAAKEKKPRGPYSKNPKPPPAKTSLSVSSLPPSPPPLASAVPPAPALPPAPAPAPPLALAPPPAPPSAPRIPTPLPVVASPVAGPCVLCKRLAPGETLAQCRTCTLSCHAGCIGLEPNVDLKSWQCLVCRNIDSKTVSKILCCSLCQSQPQYLAPDDPFTGLDVWKLSEYNSFVHMVCAIWHSELSLNASVDMSRIEGFASIPLSKRKRECALCHLSGVGACTKCDECSTFFHVSCAWSAGYKFGFEILPQKKRRPRECDLVQFGEHNGLMEPRIWCSSHPPNTDRPTCDISDLDPKTQLPALQIFMTHQKNVSADPNLEILRKARRLEAVLDSVTKPKHSFVTPLWSKALNLDDVSMVAALSSLPESCPLESLAADVASAPPVRQRKSSHHRGSNEPKLRGATRGRARGRGGRARGSGRSRNRGRSRIVVKPREHEHQDDGQDDDPGSAAEDGMAMDDPTSVSVDEHSCRTVINKPEGLCDLEHVTSSKVVTSRHELDQPHHHHVPMDLDVKSSRVMSVPREAEWGARQQMHGDIKQHQSMSHERSYIPYSDPESQFAKRDNHKPARAVPPKSVDVGLKMAMNEQPIPAAASTPIEITLKSNDVATSATAVHKPPSKLRLTIKPAHAPQQPPAPASLSLVEPNAPVHDHNLMSCGPSYSIIPPSSISHHHLSLPSRPMSSSSSSSSPSSKPIVTRLPSINQLDVFHPSSMSRHSPCPPPMSSSRYLPPISAVAPRLRSPPSGMLPPLPLMPLQHSSTLSPMPRHAPHLRFPAPLSNAPSFDAFAKGAAATAAISTMRHTSTSTGHANSSVSPVQSHQQANHSPPSAPARQNILT